MKAEQYLEDLRNTRVLDPTNLAVIKGFILAYESCKTPEETISFVEQLKSIVGSQFLQQLSQQVSGDPAFTHRYLAAINSILEQVEKRRRS